MSSKDHLPFGVPGSSTPPVVEDRREERRIHVAIPVKVYLDIKSAEWQTCCTYEISQNGARLVALPGIKQVGQVIFVQRLNRRARYKVMWIGQPGTAQAGQVGVESLEPGNVIWENEIKSRIMQAG
ncbi:MAG TPA: PilZ domain-containing protein [Candidatus Limnocylindrales bacterium]|nr:PilZ domain-containing protein [Candidatus Limnocylindrales bacterium]